MRNRIIHGCFLGTFSFVSWRTLIVHRCVTFPVSGERDLWINSRNILHFLIAELAERSPIIIQNSSNPSSRKNLDVRPYDCTTVRGATFNMRGQLYRGHANATALFSSPVAHWAPSRTTRVLFLAGARCCALETCGKKMRAPLLGLAKSICYSNNFLTKFRFSWHAT